MKVSSICRYFISKKLVNFVRWFEFLKGKSKNFCHPFSINRTFFLEHFSSFYFPPSTLFPFSLYRIFFFLQRVHLEKREAQNNKNLLVRTWRHRFFVSFLIKKKTKGKKYLKLKLNKEMNYHAPDRFVNYLKNHFILNFTFENKFFIKSEHKLFERINQKRKLI